MFGNTDIIRRTIDLSQRPKQGQLEGLFFTEDKASTAIVLDFTDENGSAVDVSGYTAELHFIRPDGVTVVQTGTANGSSVAFTVSGACLETPGGAEVSVSLGTGEARLTVWAAEAVVRRSTTDSYADPSKVVPSLSDLLAQIDNMRTATAAANAAAANASAVAESMQGQINAINAKATEALAAANDATHTFVQSSEPSGDNIRTGDRWVQAAILLWEDVSEDTWGDLDDGTWGDLVSGTVSGEKVFVFGTWQTV